MLLSELAKRLKLDELVTIDGYDPEVETVCASDLLSDILSTDKEDFVILTGLTNSQVIRTAEVVGAIAVILVRGKYPSQEMLGLARAHNIPLYVTKSHMFETCIEIGKILEGAKADGDQ